VLEPDVATAQLCAPPAGAVLAVPAPADAGLARCDEGEAFRCTGSVVVKCGAKAGCVEDGMGVGDDTLVSREAAFAILCSR
jgi:hypothetical protein